MPKSTKLAIKLTQIDLRLKRAAPVLIPVSRIARAEPSDLPDNFEQVMGCPRPQSFLTLRQPDDALHIAESLDTLLTLLDEGTR